MFTFHHANAYQVKAANGKQHIVLDSVAWDNVQFEANQYTITPDYYKGGNRAQLRRFTFELESAQAYSSNGNGTRSAHSSSSGYASGRLIGNYRLARRCVEFPSVNWDVHGRLHRHIYCSADTVDHDLYWGPTQAVMKITLPEHHQVTPDQLYPLFRRLHHVLLINCSAVNSAYNDVKQG